MEGRRKAPFPPACVMIAGRSADVRALHRTRNRATRLVEINETGERRDPERGRPVGVVGERQPAPRLRERETGREQHAAHEPPRKILRRRGRADHQREHQEHADDLRAFGDRDPHNRQKRHRDEANRHAARFGEIRLQRGEDERSGDGSRAQRGCRSRARPTSRAPNCRPRAHFRTGAPPPASPRWCRNAGTKALSRARATASCRSPRRARRASRRTVPFRSR